MPVTPLGTTVTVREALLPLPSVAAAVIVAVPCPTPLIEPSAPTVATEGLPLVQLSADLAAFAGATVALTVFKVWPTPTASDAWLSRTLETLTTGAREFERPLYTVPEFTFL